MQHIPRKRFGQHFLHDPHIIGKILAAIAPQPGEPLVEIGPGLGAITLPLLERAGALIAVELDRDVIPHLEAAARGKGKLTVVQGDALEVDLATLVPAGAKLRLVGNLPYNVSTPLLFRFLEQADCVKD
ncbi:MAG TPA: rRNA adenine dimethyltransferase family protein, partial [Gammaproteobacteria bacterium]|nr:rRNA adenine dimethyltransferase family protein [Gammaproteobacteria bacterium]